MTYFTFARRVRDMEVPSHSPSKVERGLFFSLVEGSTILPLPDPPPPEGRGLYLLSGEKGGFMFPRYCLDLLSPFSMGRGKGEGPHCHEENTKIERFNT